ncbi:putative glycosyltransferase EpsD [compost metagenome]
MSGRVLFCATVVSHLKAFHLPYLQWFKEQGWEVHAAACGEEALSHVDKQFNLSIERSPFKWSNITAYRGLKQLIDRNDYDIIHCHTPMGAVLTRLAARNARHRGTKVIYTAHGFHFFTGASKVNWLIYYPVEKWLSRYTDCLITMNREDYERIQKRRFRAKSIAYVHGVGIDFNKYKPVSADEKAQLRAEYGIENDKFVLIYAAELTRRKNQNLLFEVIDKLRERIPNIQLLLAGKGELEVYYKGLAQEMGLEDRVTFLGHRSDMNKLYAMSDLAVSSSRQEGLPVNVMEAIASGLPVVATDVRGNRDLVSDGVHGLLVELGDAAAFGEAILQLFEKPALRESISREYVRLTKLYSISNVLGEVTPIYRNIVLVGGTGTVFAGDHNGLKM